jgi:hypothetical protein
MGVSPFSVRMSEAQQVLIALWDGIKVPPKGATHDGSAFAIKKYLQDQGVEKYLQRSGLIVSDGLKKKQIEAVKGEKEQHPETDLTKFMD